MANAILCSNLLADTEINISASDAITGYPAENMRVFQPGVSYRSETDGTTVSMTFSKSASSIYTDLVALVGTNMNALPNLLLYSNDPTESSVWIPQNATVATATTEKVTLRGADGVSGITATGSGEHHVTQAWEPPSPRETTYTHQYATPLTFSVYAKLGDNLRIRVDQGSNYAYQDFNMTTGAKNGSVVSSGFTATSAIVTDAIDPVAGAQDWRRLSVSISDGLETSPTGDIIPRIQVLDSSFTASYTAAGESSLFVGPQLELAAAASDYAPTVTEHGALWRFRSSLGVFGNIVEDSKWMAFSSADNTEQAERLGFSNGIYAGSEANTSDSIILYLWDESNADGYIEVGTAVLGECFQPDINIAAGHSVTWGEEGSSSRAMGGQLYRPQNSVYRMVSMEHQFLTEAEAYESAFALQRRVGRSRGVLVSIDPDGTYSNETTVWGLLDSPSPLVRRTYSATLGGNVYQTTWEVIEALP